MGNHHRERKPLRLKFLIGFKSVGGAENSFYPVTDSNEMLPNQLSAALGLEHGSRGGNGVEVVNFWVTQS